MHPIHKLETTVDAFQQALGIFVGIAVRKAREAAKENYERMEAIRKRGLTQRKDILIGEIKELEEL